MEIKQNLRALHSEINVLSRSDGSAVFSQGDTVIIVGVNGPIEVKPMRLQIDRASIDAIYCSKSGPTSVADRLQESLIKNICEAAILVNTYPRTSISVVVQEIQDSGGLLACAVNATCVALINSGVAMKYLFAGVHCMLDQQDHIIMDPDQEQLKESKAQLTFVFDSIEKKVVSTYATGRFLPQMFTKSLLQCQQACEEIFKFYRNTVTKYANRI